MSDTTTTRSRATRVPAIVRRAATWLASIVGWAWLALYIICDEADALERRWQRRRDGRRAEGGE
jgi:hypothetical protein